MIQYKNRRQPNKAETIQSKVEIKLCVYITLITNFFVLLGKPLGIDIFVSWPTRFTIICPVLLAAVKVLSYLRGKRLQKVELCFFGILSLSLLATCFGRIGSLVSKWVQYLCFLMLPAYGILFRDLDGIQTIKKAIYIANFAYAILFIYLSFSAIAYRYIGEFGVEYLSAMTLGYSNPNETGMYLFVSFAIMLSLLFYARKKSIKFLAFAFCAYLLYCIIKTESRMCLLLALMLTLLQFIDIIRKAGDGTIKFVTIFPGISAILLILFPNFFDNMWLLDSSLENGRSFVIKPFLGNLNLGTFLFGKFSSYGGSNLHNSYLSILASFGILTLVMYVLFLNYLLREYRMKLSGKHTQCAFAAFLGIIIHGIAEATFLTAGTVYAGLAGLLFLLMLPEEAKT